MSSETQVETSTETQTESETETGTLTRTKGACAMGAGAAAITCKAMVLGFLAGGLALVGLSAISPVWLMAGVLVIGSAFIWKGFRWAGRRPALLGIASLATMWVGYVGAGYFVTGKLFTSTTFGMMPAGAILRNPWGLIPVALLYIGGTVLFFAAVYDSYVTELDLGDSKGGVAAGLAGASVCGGCGLTGLAGAAMVLMTGASATNATKFLAANAVMLVTLVGIVAYTLYARALRATGLALVGGFVAFFLDGSMYGFPAKGGVLGMLGVTMPAGAVGSIISAAITWTGLGIMFLALFMAFYPDVQILPQDLKEDVVPSETTS